MPLSRNDARRAAMGCRSLAHLRRKDAEASTDQLGRDAMLAESSKLEELAARFEAYAMEPAPGAAHPVSLRK
jgi:hypothetical protein